MGGAGSSPDRLAIKTEWPVVYWAVECEAGKALSVPREQGEEALLPSWRPSSLPQVLCRMEAQEGGGWLCPTQSPTCSLIVLRRQ
jgi:hypothetical protein